VDLAFVGFEEAVSGLKARKVSRTGTPVRPEFQRSDVAASRKALGFVPDRPVLLVTGGSQGASGLNQAVAGCLPDLRRMLPGVQILHLTGPNDVQKVKAACLANDLAAVVIPFFADMPLALNAADGCIGRAGASSIAELAAMRVPAILVPLPSSMDNHQFHNASALEATSAAILLEQKNCSPGVLASRTVEMLTDPSRRAQMREALGQWHFPSAADQIAEGILQTIRDRRSISENPFSHTPNPLSHRQTAVT
jgi:UDP-N-acetylglucosamine--N-acetylmuramyl-(pentapeptide) pyrophosphoryl-undecaprenol N-acetylglucosamine transferase